MELNFKKLTFKELTFKELTFRELTLNGLVDLQGANLQGANFEGANLRETHYLTFDQLSKVKTLHNTKLDEEVLITLKKKYPTLFEKLDE